jgi:hypothetical protein
MTTKTVRVTKEKALQGRPNGFGSGGEITEGYYIEGEESCTPKAGLPYLADRYIRNGIKQYGIFRTSEIKNIDIIDESTTIITTLNSVYKIEYI